MNKALATAILHVDANTTKESLEYQTGYSDGWFKQPEKSTDEQYKLGYCHGWNDNLRN